MRASPASPREIGGPPMLFGLFLLLAFAQSPDAALAQKKTPSDEEIAKRVKKFPLHLAAEKSETGSSQVHPDITCQDGSSETNCTVNRGGGLIGSRSYVPYAYVSAQLEGEVVTLYCSSQWVWTECRGLPAGPYHAQWANKEHTKIKVLIYYSGTKEDFLFTQIYEVTFPGRKRQGAGPLPAAKP